MISIDTDVHSSSNRRRPDDPGDHQGDLRPLVTQQGSPQNQPRPPRAGAEIIIVDVASATAQLMAFGQVFLIQSAAAVDSLWPWPGFGQFAGAVMLRIGMVMIRLGSQVGNGYSGLFLLNPVTASL